LKFISRLIPLRRLQILQMQVKFLLLCRLVLSLVEVSRWIFRPRRVYKWVSNY